MSDEQTELYRQHRTVQDKHTYFLLASAAACIALTVQRTADAAFAPADLILGAAVLSWSASFYCGCRQISYLTSMLFANMAMLKWQQGAQDQLVSKALDSNNLKEVIESINKRAHRYATWQFRFLVLGAFLFLSWHIVGMVSKANELSPKPQHMPPTDVARASRNRRSNPHNLLDSPESDRQNDPNLACDSLCGRRKPECAEQKPAGSVDFA